MSLSSTKHKFEMPVFAKSWFESPGQFFSCRSKCIPFLSESLLFHGPPYRRPTTHVPPRIPWHSVVITCVTDLLRTCPARCPGCARAGLASHLSRSEKEGPCPLLLLTKVSLHRDYEVATRDENVTRTSYLLAWGQRHSCHIRDASQKFESLKFLCLFLSLAPRGLFSFWVFICPQ